MLQKLVSGVHVFQNKVFREQQELFERLSTGQKPQTLFITCSDSRIDPNLITQTDPGDLFVLRNAGNIIPAHGMMGGGEVATIEFAVTGLQVTDIVVCGHSYCGAMNGLLHPEYLEELPAMADFLKHAEATRRIMKSKYPDLSEEERLDAAIQENVLVQIEHLQTHPAVAVALSQDALKLHGWYYDISTGDVYTYHADVAQFVPIGSRRLAEHPTPARLHDIHSGDAQFYKKTERPASVDHS